MFTAVNADPGEEGQGDLASRLIMGLSGLLCGLLGLFVY